MKETGSSAFEGYSLKRVLSAVLVGALLGYMLYPTVDRELDRQEQLYIERCGETLEQQQERCPVEPELHINW